jgi:hypothetical protein
MHRTAMLIGVAVLAAACAKSPASIAPSYISEMPFMNYSCQQLGEEEARLARAYANAAKQQEAARRGDIVSVVFVGLPVSSLSGDNIAPEIARLKGEQEAVHKAQLNKAC